MATLIRAALLGLATGSRSTLGLTTLALSASPRRRPLAAGAVLACAGELVADKLPQTPSRLEPAGLGSRITLGATAGALVARRGGRSGPGLAVAAAVGALGALAGAELGAAWRRIAPARLALSRLPADLPGALVEDGVAIGLATLAARIHPARQPDKPRRS